ncbi:hypothetical protein SHIRM173S_10714 [Streptomyces hirsutus]
MSRWTKSLADARPTAYWLDDPGRPEPRPALTGAETCDLLVVGGGYSGLWTALIAKERDPDRDVVLVEGRRGGLGRLGPQRRTLRRLPHPRPGQRPGPLAGRDPPAGAARRRATSTPSRRRSPATPSTAHSNAPANSTSPPSPTRHANCATGTGEIDRRGLADGVDLLDADAVRAQVDSPTFLAGLWDRRGVAMLHPAKLAWGLKRACLDLGVRVYEHTPALTLRPYGRRDVTAHALRADPRPHGRPRHQHLPQPGQTGPPRRHRSRPDDYALISRSVRIQLGVVGDDLPGDQREDENGRSEQQHGAQLRIRGRAAVRGGRSRSTPKGQCKGGVSTGPSGNGLPRVTRGLPSGSERRAPRGVWGGRPSDREETRNPGGSGCVREGTTRAKLGRPRPVPLTVPRERVYLLSR